MTTNRKVCPKCKNAMHREVDGWLCYPAGCGDWLPIGTPTAKIDDQKKKSSACAVAYPQRWMERDAHGSQLAHVAQALAAVPTPQTHDDKLRGNTEADCHYSPHDLSNAAILARALPFWDSPAHAYLVEGRGLTIIERLCRDLLFVPDLPYWGYADPSARSKTHLATLPAMIARLRDARGEDGPSIHVT